MSEDIFSSLDSLGALMRCQWVCESCPICLPGEGLHNYDPGFGGPAVFCTACGYRGPVKVIRENPMAQVRTPRLPDDWSKRVDRAARRHKAKRGLK